MKLRNIIVSLCLSFVKQVWFLLTLYMYNLINKIQISVSANTHDIEFLDTIINTHKDDYKDSKNE